VEVDGNVHSEKAQIKIDEHREKVFKARGILTYRIKNNEIEENLSVVLLGLRNVCELRSTIPITGHSAGMEEASQLAASLFTILNPYCKLVRSPHLPGNHHFLCR